MMRITAYSDRLADDLDRVDWPEKVKTMQRNWIGRSHGARVTFPVVAEGVPTGGARRPRRARHRHRGLHDPPRHPVRRDLHGPRARAPPRRRARPGRRLARGHPGRVDRRRGHPAEAVDRLPPRRLAQERRRAADRGQGQDGVFTGGWAVNPVTGATVPVFVADYVLMGYGTGAIMAVPGQDERDWDFATAFDLPMVRTVQPTEGHDESTAFTGEGPAINSANAELSLDGLAVAEAKAAITPWLESHRHRRAHGQLQAARLALQPPALLGRAVPGRLRRGRRRPRACPTRCCPSRCPTSPTTARRPTTPRTRAASPSRRCRGSTSGSTSTSTSATAAAPAATAARRTRCRTGPGRAGTTCATSTPPTPRRSSTPRTSRTGWGRVPSRSPAPPRARATPAASTSTSAASSTPCCTCSTRGSGTRCSTTWAT